MFPNAGTPKNEIKRTRPVLACSITEHRQMLSISVVCVLGGGGGVECVLLFLLFFVVVVVVVVCVVVVAVVVDDRFYIALFSALEQTHCVCVCVCFQPRNVVDNGGCSSLHDVQNGCVR